jgi:hypothetical protein
MVAIVADGRRWAKMVENGTRRIPATQLARLGTEPVMPPATNSESSCPAIRKRAGHILSI